MKRALVVAAVVATALAAAVAARSESSGATAPSAHNHPHVIGAAYPDGLAPLLAEGRFATGKYSTDLRRAKRHGYTTIVTRHIPDMGWHFMNTKITGFDIKKPPILVYVKRGHRWQLVAFEWVFTERPATDPLPGATYGSFAAACHYVDGTFHPASSQAACHRRSPESGAKFGFWHPDLVTLHVWLWYPNPDGVYAGVNPLMRPFN